MRKALLIALASAMTLGAATAHRPISRRHHPAVVRQAKPPRLVDSYFLRFDRDARQEYSFERATHHPPRQTSRD